MVPLASLSNSPCPMKIKDVCSRWGTGVLLRPTSLSVRACEMMTFFFFFLIGIELFFPGEKNVDMPFEISLPRKSPDAQRRHALPFSLTHTCTHTLTLSQRLGVSPTMLFGPFRASPALLAQPHSVWAGGSMELGPWDQRIGSATC